MTYWQLKNALERLKELENDRNEADEEFFQADKNNSTLLDNIQAKINSVELALLEEIE